MPLRVDDEVAGEPRRDRGDGRGLLGGGAGRVVGERRGRSSCASRSRPIERRQRIVAPATACPSARAPRARCGAQHACDRRPARLVRADHALVELGAIGVEIDEAGERAQRELALAVAAEEVGLVAERLRIELVALEPAVRDLAGAVDLAGVRERLHERAVLLAAVGVLRERGLGVGDRLLDAITDAVVRGHRRDAHPRAAHRDHPGAAPVGRDGPIDGRHRRPCAADVVRRRFVATDGADLAATASSSRAAMAGPAARRLRRRLPCRRAHVVLVGRLRRALRLRIVVPVAVAAGVADRDGSGGHDLVELLLAGPLRGLLRAIDAERVEHRRRLEHEQRGLARHHAVAPATARRLARVALARALHLLDRERRPQARHEAVARGRRDVERRAGTSARTACHRPCRGRSRRP